MTPTSGPLVMFVLPQELAERVLPLLDRHFRDLARTTGGTVHPDLMEFCRELAGAQARSVHPETASPRHAAPVRTVAEQAQHMGCTPRHVRRLCATRKLPARRSGGTWLIEVENVA